MAVSESAKDIFFEEAAEHLEILEAGFLDLETGIMQPIDANLIDKLFRSAHTLKGASALLKYNVISEISHELEELLEKIKTADVVPSERLLDAMLSSLDVMRTLLQMTHLPDYEPFAVAQGLQTCQMLQAAQTGEVVQIAPSATSADQAPQFSQNVRIGVEQIDQIMNLLGEMTITKTHLIDQVTAADKMKGEIDFARERLLREVAHFSDRYEYTNPENPELQDAHQGESMVADFEELEFDRYDELNLFSRKLQEISNDINEALNTFRSFWGQVSVDVDAMDRMTTEMKERISVMRTLPVEDLYQRFKRTFRNLTREAGVHADLVLEGGDTRLGRTVIDGLFDPLVHILRNAIAHGFEPEEERICLGKPAHGTITIRTERRGSSAVMTIADDGRGIQLEKVRRKAIALGWIDEKDKLKRQELIDLIFRPGFSTRDTADGISGRGVGMDVVLDRLSSLNGTIDVESQEGKGTRFIFQIPLSLIIINVIQFRLGNQLFVIPTALVEEIQDVQALDVIDGQVIRQRESYRLLDLNQKFDLPQFDASRRCILFVKTLGARLGLLVEEVVSQEDTVIRPLGKLLAEMPCFSGTSVSGSGNIRLVINPSRLMPLLERVEAADRCGEEQDPIRPLYSVPRVLVVDDSLSVRKYASLILQAHQVEVLTATNGQEALDLLDHEKVDLVFTDLEMPVMHGYELLAEIKRRKALKYLPVVVITSRSGTHHQDKALQMGAAGYLVKPFDEEQLMDMLHTQTLCSL